MTDCDHIAWLRVTGAEGITLYDEGRMRRLMTELTHPRKQKPTIILFLGHRAKNIALRELFPYNNIRRGQGDGIASLRIDTATLHSDFPIFFADSNPSVSLLRNAVTPICHEVKTYSLYAKDRLAVSLFDFFHARFLCLFSDVICIFAEDFESLDSVVNHLRAWAAAGSANKLFHQIRPRVVVVVKGDDASPTYSLLQAQDLRFNLHQQDLISFFSSITVLRLADGQISPLARHRRLKEVLLRHADEMRQLRQTAGCLYSAAHLTCFSEEAIRHIAEEAHLPFDFLLISRRQNMVSQDYCEHLENFFRISNDMVSHEETLSIVASSVLMDAYPPGMHAFDPGLVYDAIYQPFFLKALGAFFGTPDAIARPSRAVREIVTSMFGFMTEQGIPAHSFHFSSLRKRTVRWDLLKSNRTCLSCIRRTPEHVLSCGHALCDTCVRIFGAHIPGSEYRYQVVECILCGLGTMTKTLKPPTAGARILSIDGGGVRGVVPLEFLAMLQSTVGPICAIQDLFDLAVGTSSGGLLVLSLFLQRWSVSKCARVFDTLAKQFFKRRDRVSSNILRRLRSALKCWIADGCYEVGDLEATLRLQFGDHRKVFDYTHYLANTKVAVTATLVSDASPVIFSNYNGAGFRSEDCGYKHFRPHNIEEEVCAWEAGRATSAAPILFKPVEIAGVGLVQDGGLAHNNPASLAEWECRQIWPQHQKPDIVVSLGTGVTERPSSQDDSQLNNFLLNGFVPRLWRSFMSSLDGQRAWADLLNRLDEKARADYFRLNVSLPGKEVAIDDIDSMEELRLSVRQQPQSLCFDVSAALLVSSFFFELTKAPAFHAGSYRCEGLIRCRLSADVIFQALSNSGQASWIFMMDSEVLGHYTPMLDRCQYCSRYKKFVTFCVRHPSDLLNIHMQNPKLQRRKISGMPETLEWFVSQQHLRSEFGNPYHGALDSHLRKQCCSSFQEHGVKRKEDGNKSSNTRFSKRVKLQ